MKILFFIPIFVNAIQNVTGDSNEFYVEAVRYRVLLHKFSLAKLLFSLNILI